MEQTNEVQPLLLLQPSHTPLAEQLAAKEADLLVSREEVAFSSPKLTKTSAEGQQVPPPWPVLSLPAPPPFSVYWLSFPTFSPPKTS
jgi:hypothetical protein